jgi:hypothetical protein
LPIDSHSDLRFESEQVRTILAGHGALQGKIEELMLAVCICHHGQRVRRFSAPYSEKPYFKSVYPEDEG